MNINNFKEINRAHGYQAGDFVLAETGKILADQLRGNDWRFRIDAYRFACILPNTSKERGLKVCERLREVLVNRLFLFDTHKIHVMVSFGLASLRDATEKESAILLTEASQALNHDEKQNTAL
jgi:diguanylate cyclase